MVIVMSVFIFSTPFLVCTLYSRQSSCCLQGRCSETQNGGKKMFKLVLWQQAVRMNGSSICSHELAVTEANCIATCITYI